jgi:hypothetical protein
MSWNSVLLRDLGTQKLTNMFFIAICTDTSWACARMDMYGQDSSMCIIVRIGYGFGRIERKYIFRLAGAFPTLRTPIISTETPKFRLNFRYS